MTKKIFYERIGRKYVPVAEYSEELMDSYPFPKESSCHIVVRGTDSTMRRHNIDPELAPLIAAGMLLEDDLVDVIVKCSEYVPPKDPITPAQQKAWKNMQKAFDGLSMIRGKSKKDVAIGIVELLKEKAADLHKNKAVKAAFEQYVLLCKLTK